MGNVAFAPVLYLDLLRLMDIRAANRPDIHD